MLSSSFGNYLSDGCEDVQKMHFYSIRLNLELQLNILSKKKFIIVHKIFSACIFNWTIQRPFKFQPASSIKLKLLLLIPRPSERIETKNTYFTLQGSPEHRIPAHNTIVEVDPVAPCFSTDIVYSPFLQGD